MTEIKKQNRLRIVLMDLLFSLGINFFYIIAAGLSSFGHRIGGSGDGGMIWILFFFLWSLQFILSFLTLTSFEIFKQRTKRKQKILIYSLTNSFILIVILININERVFEGNNTILLYNLIVFIGFILLYKRSITKNGHGKFIQSKRK
ncbi:MAG: hypothetical protein ABFR05_13335 [Bacteroidota bacterium]